MFEWFSCDYTDKLLDGHQRLPIPQQQNLVMKTNEII